MPAIRVTGDDFKPQAFDVYSPKILAAIMGLEDILASRCIAIPMRRTNKKMPSFPPDFDGAAIRHNIYTLRYWIECGFKELMGKIGIKARTFNDLLKAVKSTVEEKDQDAMPEILGDDVPLLSPALGFQRDVAMLTVTVIERTKDNRLNTQPYLVTSTRELRHYFVEQAMTQTMHRYGNLL